jgi:uncharacterized protein (DUF433 family)
LPASKEESGGERGSLPFPGKAVCLDKEPAMAALDWSQCPAVESVPGKVSGAWVLKGTRMPVSAIFENLEAGANLDDIMEWYDGLDRAQVKAVIEFAARSLDGAAQASPQENLREHCTRLEKTQPGSEESKRISEQIIDAIG